MKGQSDTRFPAVAPILAYSILTILIFGAQYGARRLDDNRLTSWQWVFAHADPHIIAALIAAGLFGSFVLSRWSWPDRRPAIFLLIVSFGAASLFWGEPEVIIDASRYFTQAKHLELFGVSFYFKEWGHAIPAWTDLPFLPFLYGLLFTAFGESRLWVQIFTTALFSFTVLFTYFVGRTLWDEDVGFSAGLLLLAMPYLLTQVPLMLVDVGTMCFFMLAILLSLLAIRTGSPLSLALAPVAILLVILSKYSAWLMLSVLAVLFLIHLGTYPAGAAGQAPAPGASGDESGRRRARTRSVIIRGGIVFAGAILLTAPVLFAFRNVLTEQIGLLLSYQRPGLRRWGESFVSTFFYQVHPIITAAAIFSLAAAVKTRDRWYAVVAWPLLLLLVMRVERIRYLVTVLPLFSLMAAYGLRKIDDRRLIRFVVLCAVTGSLVVAIGAYLPFLKSVSAANLKAAGEYLDTLQADPVAVYTLPDEAQTLNTAVFVPLLDIYTRKTLYYDYRPGSFPPPDKIRVSALRFTWEYRNPRYYSPLKGSLSGKPGAIVVIASSPDQTVPDYVNKMLRGYRVTKRLQNYEGIYQSRTVVSIFEPSPGIN